MEKRIGSILIVVYSTEMVSEMNRIISDYGTIILGRQGLSLKEKALNVISLVVEGSTDEIGAMTGKLGRLKGISVKSVIAKNF